MPQPSEAARVIPCWAILFTTATRALNTRLCGSGKPWLCPGLWPRSARSGTPSTTLAETVIGLYDTECVKVDGPFRTIDELELATLSWVHWFNENRLHSALGYLTPLEVEEKYYRENTSQTQPRPGELALH